ncbi:MAG TPA: RHS repeat-associated core domain-containing protein [Chloroflexota bacterium]
MRPTWPHAAQTVVVSGTTSYTDTYVYSQHGMPLELLRTTNGVLNRYWYERDGLGNVVALTDSNGTVVDQYAYDLWGTPTTVSETVPQQLRYQGYWYDNELAWYWLTTRAYDPALKRFLQPVKRRAKRSHRSAILTHRGGSYRGKSGLYRPASLPRPMGRDRSRPRSRHR